MSTTMPPSDLDLAPTEPAPPLLDHERSPTTFFEDCVCGLPLDECVSEVCAAFDASPKTAGAT